VRWSLSATAEEEEEEEEEESFKANAVNEVVAERDSVNESRPFVWGYRWDLPGALESYASSPTAYVCCVLPGDPISIPKQHRRRRLTNRRASLPYHPFYWRRREKCFVKA
jgi:hypothetical protein